jgi:hypothetical protein
LYFGKGNFGGKKFTLQRWFFPIKNSEFKIQPKVIIKIHPFKDYGKNIAKNNR